MILNHLESTKEKAQQGKQSGPGHTTQNVEQHEGVPLHATHASKEGHKGADEREEAAKENCQVAPLIKEGLGLLDALRSHGLYLARRNDALAKEMTNHKVALVAQDGRRPSHAKQRKDVEAAISRKATACKQQRVARQKRHEHHASLDKDNQKDKTVRSHGTSGNPSSNCRARVFKQLNNGIDKTHEVKPLDSGADTPK